MQRKAGLGRLGPFTRVERDRWSRRTANGFTGWKCAVPDFPAFDADSSKTVVYRLTARPLKPRPSARLLVDRRAKGLSLFTRGCRSSSQGAPGSTSHDL